MYFLVIGFRFDTAAPEKKLVEARFRIHHEQIALALPAHQSIEVDLPRLFISTK